MTDTCEKCKFYGPDYFCHRYPHTLRKAAGDYCGEFKPDNVNQAKPPLKLDHGRSQR